jgi:hypothetical protein
MSTQPSSISEIDLAPISGKSYFDGEREWREEFIYFLLVDRFHDDKLRTPVNSSSRSAGSGTLGQLKHRPREEFGAIPRPLPVGIVFWNEHAENVFFTYVLICEVEQLLSGSHICFGLKFRFVAGNHDILAPTPFSRCSLRVTPIFGVHFYEFLPTESVTPEKTV